MGDVVSALHVGRVLVSARGRVPSAALRERLPASPYALGADIAQRVHDYAVAHALGYYPALDFAQQQGVIEDYLVAALEQIAAISMEYARHQARDKLLGVFSSVNFHSLHATAYTLPTVRMSQPEALAQLAKHYTPDTVKFELIVTVLQKQKMETGLDSFARRAVQRWLEDAFEDFEITSTRHVEA